MLFPHDPATTAIYTLSLHDALPILKGEVWPVSVESASLCAQYGDGSTTSGEVEVDAGQSAGHQIARLWLEPWVNLHPAAARSEEHTSELQSQSKLVCRLLLEKKNQK